MLGAQKARPKRAGETLSLFLVSVTRRRPKKSYRYKKGSKAAPQAEASRGNVY
jgi:hypothetical protein